MPWLIVSDPIGTDLWCQRFHPAVAAALMMRYSFGLDADASLIERAVEAVLTDGCRTGDLADKGSGSDRPRPARTEAHTLSHPRPQASVAVLNHL